MGATSQPAQRTRRSDRLRGQAATQLERPSWILRGGGCNSPTVAMHASRVSVRFYFFLRHSFLPSILQPSLVLFPSLFFPYLCLHSSLSLPAIFRLNASALLRDWRVVALRSSPCSLRLACPACQSSSVRNSHHTQPHRSTYVPRGLNEQSSYIRLDAFKSRDKGV